MCLNFVQLEFDGNHKNLQLTWHPLQGPQNVFSPASYPLYYLQCYYLGGLVHGWLEIIWLKSHHNVEW